MRVDDVAGNRYIRSSLPPLPPLVRSKCRAPFTAPFTRFEAMMDAVETDMFEALALAPPPPFPGDRSAGSPPAAPAAPAAFMTLAAERLDGSDASDRPEVSAANGFTNW